MRAWRATNITRDLSGGQRFLRLLKFATGSGAYVHPDGHYELDFEEAAGIDSRNDPDEVQQAKLAAYEQRKGQRDVGFGRLLGAGVLGFIAYRFAGRVGMEGFDASGVGLMAAYGLWLISRQ